MRTFKSIQYILYLLSIMLNNVGILQRKKYQLSTVVYKI